MCVRARYQDVEGDFCLAMPMSTDVAIIFGRELFGEPKKQARVQLKSDGDVMRASVERFGGHDRLCFRRHRSHAQRLEGAMEQLLSKTMASLDDRLTTQANSIEVSDEDAKKAYEEHPERFGAPERRTDHAAGVRHQILEQGVFL